MILNIKEGLNLNTFSLSETNVLTFPIDGLPSKMQEYITDCAKVHQTPMEFFAMSSIMAISASLKNRVYLQTKYRNYAQLWGMLVAPSGVGKSEPISTAFKPIECSDSERFAAYQNQFRQWESDCIAARKEKQPEPIKPYYSQSLVTDVTPEALFNTLFHNSSLTLCRDELSGWFADFGRYAKSGEISHYLSTFNNMQIKINRKQSEPLLIDNPFLNVFGGIQPSVLSKTFSTDSLSENGMIQRFLFVYPNEVKKAKYHEGFINEELKAWYKQFIDEILNYQFPEDCKYYLSIEAERFFIEFSDSMTDKINETPDEYLRAVYSKMEIHCLRLALTVYMAKQFTGEEDGTGYLDAETMKYAIRLCEYFIFTAEKVYSLILGKQSVKKTGVGDLIRSLNIEHPIINQAMFAESLGVTRQYISKILK